MEIRIQTVHFSADSKLEEYVNAKVGKLDTYFDRITDAEVYLKLDSNEKVKDKVAEIKLNIPGTTLFASDTTKSFEESIDNSVEQIRRQLLKYKEKLHRK